MSNIQAAINDTINSISFSDPAKELTKQEVINNLQENIDKFLKLKDQLTKMFIENNKHLQNYNNKLKNAKHDYSRDLYRKKVDRYKKDAIEILIRMESIDTTIKNLEDNKNKILNPEEENTITPNVEVV